MSAVLRRLRIAAVAVALGLFAGAVALPAPALAAVPSGIEVSDDGVTFTSAMSRNLFGSLARIVPGGTQTDFFYLRNAGTVSGILRIVLRDVVTTSPSYADALKITVRTTALPGTWGAVSKANPCWRMLEGEVLAPGDVVRVDAAVFLDNLNGQSGQGATATVGLALSLSDAAAGSTPDTSCGGPATILPVGAGPSRPTAKPVFVSVPVSGPDVVVPPVDDGSLPTDALPTDPSGFAVPNTFLLHEEYLVLILIGAGALGYGLRMAGAYWRRRFDYESDVIP